MRSSLGITDVPSYEVWSAASSEEQLRIEHRWLECIAGRATTLPEVEFAAFEALYRAYLNPLHGIARARLSAADAIDIVQSVFLGVWKCRRELPPDTVLQAYLRGAIHHRLQNARAGQAVHLRLVTADHGDAVPGFRESRVASADEMLEYQDAVLAALNGLPEQTRLTVVLFFALAFTRRQIASLLNISVRSVKHHLSAARAPIKSLIDKRPPQPKLATGTR